MSLDEQFYSYYTPLVTEFCKQIADPLTDDFLRTPRPFLPLFGSLYAESQLRIIFVGMETRGCDDAKTFIENGRNNPTAMLRDQLSKFRNLDFCDWTNNFGYTFFDFVLFLLAKVHKLPDFRVLKRKRDENILQSFAWGNCNAIERYCVTSQKQGTPPAVWEQTKTASRPLDRAKHLVESLQPDVMIVMWKDMNPATYFDGLDYTQEPFDGDIKHFVLNSGKIHLFGIPHPQYMSRRRKQGQGREYFAEQLECLFKNCGLVRSIPALVQASNESEKLMQSLINTVPKEISKYECVEWLAGKVIDQDSVMTIPALASTLNELGHRTNYGTEYLAGRGTYRLVKSVYDKCDRRGDHAMALKVAKAFVRPNGGYAYG